MHHQIRQTLADFGQTIGLDSLDFNENQVFCLEIESIGHLYIEEQQDHILMYLIREYQHMNAAFYQKALSLCQIENTGSAFFQVGLLGDQQLIWATRLGLNEMTLPDWHAAIDQLEQLHQQMN